MPKLTAYRVLLVASFWCAILPARGQNSEFAGCNSISAETTEANKILSKEQRLRALEQASSDIRKLVQEMQASKSPFPRNVLQSCFGKKNQILQLHLSNADSSTRDSARFYRVRGIVAWLNSEIDPSSKVRDLTESYEALGQAVNRDPKDWSSKEDRAMVYFSLSGERIKNAAKGSIGTTEIDEFYRTTQSLIDALVGDPTAPADVKINALRSRAFYVSRVFAHKSRAVADWRKILEISKNHVEALIEIGTYQRESGRPTDALPYFVHLSALNPGLLEIFEPYLDVLYQVRDFSTVVKVFDAFPKDPRRSALALSRVARALTETGNFTRAEKENSLALKLAPSDAVAKGTSSLILEHEADALAGQKLLSAAIQKYDAAYRLDSNRPALRKKMSLIIFRNRQERSFLPQSAAREEMQFVAKTLDAIKDRPELGSDGSELLIFAADYAELSKVAMGACQAFERDFGPYVNAETVGQCARAYATSGEKNKAKELLHFAIGNQKFSSARIALQEQLKLLGP